MARRRSPASRRGRALAAALAGAAALVAGCAAVPSSGQVQSAAAPPGGSGNNCCGLIMSGPRPGMDPIGIVSGFLLASASFAHHNAIAREYLTPAASRSWSPGSSVTIVDPKPTVVAAPRGLEPGTSGTAVRAGRVVATVSSSGLYHPLDGKDTAQVQTFGLVRVKGQWRISSLPGSARVSRQLLLPEGLFNLVYKPQNLYFYAQGSSRVLVPAPVFVPSESSGPKTNDPATMLVRDLLSGPPSWLAGAADSAFPPGTKLREVQVLPGTPGTKTAIVSLTMPPRAVQPARLRALDAQLVWALTSQSYGEPLIQSVKLKVNGNFWPRSGSAVLGQADYRQDVPQPAAGNPYFVSQAGGVRILARTGPGSRAKDTAVPGPVGAGRFPLSQIAVSPDRTRVAGIAAPRSTVYVGNLAAAAAHGAGPSAGEPRPRLSGTSFSTPSWDGAGNLWLAGRMHGQNGIWVLRDGRGTPWQVTPSDRLGRVTALRVAPDGVRVAMIAGKGASTRLLLGALIRTGSAYGLGPVLRLAPNLTGISALTWYDADHLLAVTKSASGGTQLWEVPVNGGTAVKQGAPQQGIVSVAAAGPRNPLYLGLSTGRVERSAGLREFWSDVAAGRDVAYPG
ncbi:MAG: GerMN domain-containing protein [Actinobacteria bacterium]|nr:GerMN domain-containing protein [Actinomycetota bacterium]